MKVYACKKCGETFATSGEAAACACPFCRAPLGAAPDEVELSICAPMWCEEGVVEEFVERCARAASSCTDDFEILIVDDGSTDSTWEMIGKQARQRSFLRGIRHSRNFGLQAAVTTALERARGRAVLILDGDLEDPPELIPELFQKWRQGAEIVYTVKEGRKTGVLRSVLFKMFHWLFSHLASPHMVPHSGLFCLLDRRAVEAINALPERVRYIPGLRSWIGFRQEEILYTRDRRYDIRPRQSLLNLFQLAINAITSFSSVPLQIGLGVGFLSMVLSLLAILVIICVRVFTDRGVPGWATYTSLIIGVGGFLSLYISIIGCYLGHVYMEVKRRPHSLVNEEV